VVMEDGGEVMVTRQMPMLVRTRMIIVVLIYFWLAWMIWFVSYDAVACEL